MPEPFAIEKRYEALDYFSRNVKYAGKVKLFKLLYYLDLLVFRRTGKMVTGLRYEAWPMGPVPAELDAEFKDPSSELHQRFEVKESARVENYIETTIDTDESQLEAASYFVTHTPTTIRGRRSYQHRFLTRREQQIAQDLAEMFNEATAKDMTDVSHGKFGPWRKAVTKGKQLGIERPDIDFMEGIVAVGNTKEELPLNELQDIVEERRRIDEALR